MTFSTSEVAVCMLQRLRQIARARLHLVEQAHVLDRDDSLVGEGLDELDLALSEPAGLPTRQTSAPSTRSFPSNGTPEQRARYCQTRQRNRIFRIRRRISGISSILPESKARVTIVSAPGL